MAVEVKVFDDIYEVGGVYNQDLATGACRGDSGLTRAAMEVYGFQLPATVEEDGWYPRRHMADGAKETREEGRQRARLVADRLLEIARSLETEDRTVGIVSHGDFLGQLLEELLSTRNASFKFWNTALSVLDLQAEGDSAVKVGVKFINSVPHLDNTMFRAGLLGNV